MRLPSVCTGRGCGHETRDPAHRGTVALKQALREHNAPITHGQRRRMLQGNAAEDSKGELHCQHGKTECWANTMLSCVMNHHPEQEQFFKCAPL